MLNKYKSFLDEFFTEFNKTKIDLSEFKIDHIAYLASDRKDYEEKKQFMLKYADEIDEKLVGDIHVGIYKLENPLVYNNEKFDIVEIIEPKTPQDKGRWEHVEFISNKSPHVLIDKYPNFNWKNNLNRDIFPMITLKLENQMKAKFPKRGAESESHRLNKS